MISDITEAQIEISCKELRLPGLRQQYRALIREAIDQQMDHTQFLKACLEQELHDRHQKKQQTLLRQATQRYEQGSLIITSNLEFSRWIEVLSDPALTSALLDRLTHHSHILLFEGESYRFRESLARQEQGVTDNSEADE